MQKRIIIILLFVVILLGALFFIVSRDKDIEQSPRTRAGIITAASDDGIVKLEVPQEAIPEGVSPGDIMVRRASLEEVAAELGINSENLEVSETFLAYALLPDGLSLRKPATISFSVSATTHIPAIFHIHDGEVDLIYPETAGINLRENVTTVAGSISHFSITTLDTPKLDLFKIAMVSGGTAEVGGSVPFRLTITPSGSMSWSNYEFRQAPGTPWSVGAADFVTSGVLDPQKFKSPKKNLKFSEKYTFEKNYTCAKEGTDFVEIKSFESTLKIEYRQWERIETGTVGKELTVYRPETLELWLTSELYECKKKEPVPAFECAGPPYLVVCKNGTSLSGNTKTDAQCKPLHDAAGNPIDKVTGKPVICP